MVAEPCTVAEALAALRPLAGPCVIFIDISVRDVPKRGLEVEYSVWCSPPGAGPTWCHVDADTLAGATNKALLELAFKSESPLADVDAVIAGMNDPRR